MSASKCRLLRGKIEVADGDWTAALVEVGVPEDAAGVMATLSHAQFVAALTRKYVEAGAHWVSTNTLHANRYRLAEHDRADDVEALNRKAAELARNAVAGTKTRVMGVIGPSAKILTIGEVDEDELREAVATQAQALLAGGVDALSLMSFTELREVLLSIEVVRGLADLPIVASMTFDSGPQRTMTHMGARAEECASAIEDAGADAVGCDGGAGFATALPAVVALRSNTDLPVWARPSASLPELRDGGLHYEIALDDLGNHVTELIDAGADVIGGGVGIGPAQVKRIAAIVKSHQRPE